MNDYSVKENLNLCKLNKGMPFTLKNSLASYPHDVLRILKKIYFFKYQDEHAAAGIFGHGQISQSFPQVADILNKYIMDN
jgi:hypothetical protein